MAIHDAYARRTPYELFLPDDDFAEERFPAIRAEADDREVDLSDPDRFVMLMAAGDALRELKGPGDDAARIRQHGLLLFHAWHFRDAGEPLWLLTTPAARYVVEASAGPGSSLGAGPPAPAGYLQLPRYLFWARDEADAGAGDAVPAPEPVDGIFWTSSSERVSALAVVGVREDRPGFVVVPLSSLPVADAPGWAGTDMRASGSDFRSDMPGAELDALYEVRTAGELLKLLARAWSLMDPEAVRREEPPAENPEAEASTDADASGEATEPRPSDLPFYRITL